MIVQILKGLLQETKEILQVQQAAGTKQKLFTTVMYNTILPVYES